MKSGTQSQQRANRPLERMFWLLRGPFPASRVQRSVGASVAIVVFPVFYAVWTIIQAADARPAVPLAMLAAMMGGILFFGQRRNGAQLTVGALACGIWLAGSIHLAQATFILATGRVPHRVVREVVVPRTLAIWPFLFAMGFWSTGWVLWLWNQRRIGPRGEAQRLSTRQAAGRPPSSHDPTGQSNSVGRSTSPAPPLTIEP